MNAVNTSTTYTPARDEAPVLHQVAPEQQEIPFNDDMDNVDISSLPPVRPAKTFRPSERIGLIKKVQTLSDLESLKNVDSDSENLDGIQEMLALAEDVLLKIAVNEADMNTWISEAKLEQIMKAFMQTAESLGKSLQ